MKQKEINILKCRPTKPQIPKNFINTWKSGVIDAGKVLVGLYEEPERPPNAVEYIKRYLGAPAGVDVEALKSENARLKKENAALQEKVEKREHGKGDE